jgi:Tol biopolymer transport system component
MTNRNDQLDRARLLYPPPDDSYERLLQRRDRRHASSRLAAGAVALLITVVALGAVLVAFRAPHDAAHAGSSTSGVPPVSEGSAWMVVELMQGDVRNLFVADLDGSNSVSISSRITTGDNDQAGALSPDGTEVVYSSGKGLVLINVDGSGRTQLSTTYDYVPSWSPDGSQVAFARAGSDNAMSIFVMNADGSGVRRLTPPGTSDYGPPSWSPDGSRILFQRADPNTARTNVWEMNADGTDATMLIPDASNPRWSPDGMRIAFVRGGNVWVKSVDAAGTPPVQITDLGTRPDAGDIVWSPDGNRIAFSHDDAVWTVTPDGMGLTRSGLPLGASPTSWGTAPAGS